MPTFDWNIDPVMFRVPRTGLLYAVSAIGGLSVLWALIKKNSELLSTGLIIAAAAGVGWVFLKNDFDIRYYSLLFVLVFLGGHAFLNWQIVRGGGREEDAGDFIVYGVIGVLAGSRLGHVLFYDFEHALRDPIWVFKIWEGGLASHGAVIGLILAMYVFTRRRGVPFLEGADRFAFSAALGATLVRLGNFFNSEIVGRPTDQTWGVRFLRYAEANDATPLLRHPSQLYEVTLGLTVMLVLYIVDRAFGKEKRPRGLLISTFFLVYFIGRFGVEFVKEFQIPGEDEWPLTMGQFLSLPGAALGFYGVYWALKNRLPVGWGEADDLDDEDDEDDEDEDERGDDENEDADEGDRDPDDDDSDGADDDDADADADDDDADADDDEEDSRGGMDPDVAAEFDEGGLKKKPPASER